MKKILSTATLGLMVIAGLTSCASEPSIEEQFVTTVREDLDTGFSKSELIGVARDACDAVAAGGGQQALHRLIMASGLDAYDYGVVVGNGLTYFCPDQADAFDTIMNG